MHPPAPPRPSAPTLWQGGLIGFRDLAIETYKSNPFEMATGSVFLRPDAKPAYPSQRSAAGMEHLLARNFTLVPFEATPEVHLSDCTRFLAVSMAGENSFNLAVASQINSPDSLAAVPFSLDAWIPSPNPPTFGQLRGGLPRLALDCSQYCQYH